MTPLEAVAVAVAGFAAGAINAVAGGGSLVSFPALLAIGLGSLSANATSTVGLVSGSASATWGYREHLRAVPRARIAAVVAPSVAGGVIGAHMVVAAGEAFFDAVVPFLVLGATALFAAAEPIRRAVLARIPAGGTPTGRLGALACAQLLVAVYGGFFGAGIGILMLAAFALAGEPDVHRANALKSLAALGINLAAAISFLASGQVHLVAAGVLAVAATAGGSWGAGLALRVGPVVVRRLVVGIGVAIGIWQLVR
jgi:uncharacterized protein